MLCYDYVNRVLPHWGETNKKLFQILELQTNEILSDYFLIGPEPTVYQQFWTLFISHKFEQICLTFWFMKLQVFLKRIVGIIFFLSSRGLCPYVRQFPFRHLPLRKFDLLQKYYENWIIIKWQLTSPVIRFPLIFLWLLDFWAESSAAETVNGCFRYWLNKINSIFENQLV